METPRDKRKKPRTCPHCSRNFRRHEHLQRHLRIHTNEKPYRCACGALFARRDLLKRHEGLAHSHSEGSSSIPTPGGGLGETQDQTQEWPFSAPEPVAGYQTGVFITTMYSTVANRAVYDAFQDFEQLSRSLGFSSDWTLSSEPDLAQFVMPDIPAPAGQAGGQTGGHTSGQTNGQDEQLSQLPVEKDSVDLKVTEDHRARLVDLLQQCQSPIGDSAMPSCHSLTRFVNAFFDGFYPHVPVVHIPTFKLEDCTPEILLAMAALGAQYRHEHRKAALMFFASKAIFHGQVQDRQNKTILRTISSDTQTQTQTQTQTTSQRDLMREARCAYYLIAFATWQREPEIVREAFNLTGFLARSIRESGLDESREIDQHSANTTDWHAWVEQESHRRIKLFSFALLNLHSVAFHAPPVVLVDEIRLRLPSSCMEWLAPCREKWSMVRSFPSFHEQMMLPDALAHVFEGVQPEPEPDPEPEPSMSMSPLANYILIHALIQRILLMHRVFPQDHALQSHKEDIRNALRAWTTQWQKTPESSLDPRNPNGPVTFTSTALLGLAYVRLAFDMGSGSGSGSTSPSRGLTSNAVHIATHLRTLPPLPRSPHLLPAVLHAAHALSIPVKLGVDFVVRCHAYSWSIQHSLCGVEFAVFISKWLFCIASKTLNDHESRLITWLSDIVEEGRTSGDKDLCAGPVSPHDCVHLAFAAVKLWARLIRGNTQWTGVAVLGDGLDLYADSLVDQPLDGD